MWRQYSPAAWPETRRSFSLLFRTELANGEERPKKLRGTSLTEYLAQQVRKLSSFFHDASSVQARKPDDEEESRKMGGFRRWKRVDDEHTIDSTIMTMSTPISRPSSARHE